MTQSYTEMVIRKREREKVLDRLEKWLESYLNTGYEGSAEELKAIKKKIKELRDVQE